MTDEVKITLRYPRTLHAALTKLAAANRRSINAEVVMAIEGHVAHETRPYVPSRIVPGLTVRNDRADLNATIKRLQKNRTIERPAKVRK